MSDHTLKSSKSREKLLAISAGGICIAIAFVLSKLPMNYTMPQGGSVTPASMLPIIFFALCFGPAWGFAAAFIFSLLQLIGGYLLMPVQVLLDYTLAFTSLGFAGFFAAKMPVRITETNIFRRLRLVPFYKMVFAVVVSMLGRLVFTFISGIVFFAEYAKPGQAPWLYSLGYNGTYLIPEAAITIILLFAMKGFIYGSSKKAEIVS
jgi:thiamine transporter